MKTYLFVYTKEADGEIIIEKLTSDNIKEKIKLLDYSDYAIIDGEIINSIPDLKKFQF